MARGEQRFKCVCAYDGTEFCGWQSQAGGGSIQDFIEGRLAEIFKKKVRIHGSGRTDAGVHANAQVFHFDAEWSHGTESLLKAMRCGYPKALQISKISVAKGDFHARYSVKGKRYIYRIYEGYAPPVISRYRWSLGGRKLDIAAMNDAASALLGTHDFTAFSANRGNDAKDNPVKTLTKLEVSRRGKEIKITTEGSGYLYKMVRLLAGALVDVGLGKLSKGGLISALESKKRGNTFQAAPALGLFLDRVFY